MKMIEMSLTEKEFSLLTDWAMKHFWDNTEKFEDGPTVDEMLDWSRMCLLMARLISVANEHGVSFGYDEGLYEEDDEDKKKVTAVTSAFVQQFNSELKRKLDKINEAKDD